MNQLSLLLVASFLFVGTSNVQASDKSCCKPDDCCTDLNCTPMSCRPVYEEVPIMKTCFEVECEQICIPSIKLPWQDCCTPRECGKVITVKRLKKHEYQCGTKCVAKWILEPCCDYGSCKPDCCTTCDQSVTTPPSPVPAPAVSSAYRVPAESRPGRGLSKLFR